MMTFDNFELPTLYTDTVLNGNTGIEYTLVVEPDWMAGHGMFVDENGKPNRFRWTVYMETPHRPRASYKYNVGDLNMAIVQGREKLRSFR